MTTKQYTQQSNKISEIKPNPHRAEKNPNKENKIPSPQKVCKGNCPGVSLILTVVTTTVRKIYVGQKDHRNISNFQTLITPFKYEMPLKSEPRQHTGNGTQIQNPHHNLTSQTPPV